MIFLNNILSNKKYKNLIKNQVESNSLFRESTKIDSSRTFFLFNILTSAKGVRPSMNFIGKQQQQRISAT